MAFHLNEVDVLRDRIFGEDVETGIVVRLFDRDATQILFSIDNRSDRTTINLINYGLVWGIYLSAKQTVDKSLWNYERCRNDGWGLVGDIFLLGELFQSTLFTCRKVIGSLTSLSTSGEMVRS